MRHVRGARGSRPYDAAMTDAELRAYLLEHLGHLGLGVRPMFGGYGLYLGEKFIGVVSDGAAWFRTDEASRPAYVSRGMPALQPKYRPRGPKTVDRNFRVPDEVLADPPILAEWALRAARA